MYYKCCWGFLTSFFPSQCTLEAGEVVSETPTLLLMLIKLQNTGSVNHELMVMSHTVAFLHTPVHEKIICCVRIVYMWLHTACFSSKQHKTMWASPPLYPHVRTHAHTCRK